MTMSEGSARRAAIYLRISLDREMDGLAIERQREDCQRLAEREGWTIVETYIDQSKSATDATKSRPDYDRMVADYEAGAFDAIVCWDLDRLTRQPRQMEDWVDAARFRGLLLKSVSGDVDLTNENGLLIAGIKIQVARAEVVRKSKRQSRAQKQRAAMGRAPKGMRPLGYATNGDVIEHEATAVRAIYGLFTKTENPESLRSLARALSGADVIEGIEALPKHTHTVSVERESARKQRAEEENRPYEAREPKPDGPWSPSTVLGILRNPRYAGMSTYTPKEFQKDGNRRRTWRAQILRDDAGEPIRGQWESIIDDETWWKVQEILDDKKRVTNTSGSTKRKRLGSGLYRCGLTDPDSGQPCGKKVTGAPRGYTCPGHMVRSGPAIDDFVTGIISGRLSEPDAVRQVPATTNNAETQAIDAAISAQRAKISRAQHDYDAEIIEGHDLKRVRDAAESSIQELEAQRLLQGRAGALAPVLGTDDPAKAFREASLHLRRQVIDALATVSLQPQPRGRKGFDPASVEIVWK